MISILIPTHNYTTYPLAEALSQQVTESDIPCEIIVADDASTLYECKQANRRITSLPHCTYLELPHNIGRAAIRNLLANKAHGEWLLFMDCDGMPMHNNFLKIYNQVIIDHPEAQLICGGISHPKQLPDPSVSLRYKYEKSAEKHHTASKRNEHPYESFRTFNFMIQRNVFKQVKFDESFKHYGYEDVLFGMQLQASRFHILHIDNPSENKDIEPNDIFLRKTEEALRTLTEHVGKLGNSVRLHRQYRWLKQLGVIPLIHTLFRLSSPILRKNLIGKSPNLYCFAFYKLGYYAYYSANHSQRY